MNFIHKILTFFKIILVLSIILIKFNLIPKTMPFVNIIEYNFKILVAIFIMNISNPFSKTKKNITQEDKIFIFAGGIILFLSINFKEYFNYINKFIDNIEIEIKK